MKFPLVFLVFFLISGILSGHVFNVCGSLLYEILLISVLCVLFISIRKKQEALLYCCLAVSWILVGMLLIIPYNQPSFLPDDIVHYASGEECIFDGTVIDITPFTDDKFRATVAASAIIHEKEYIPVSGNVRLNVKNTREDIHYGDIIRVKSKLKKPRNFNNPGGFDYVRHLGLRGIYTTASVRKPSNILILRRNGGNAVMRKTEQCRRYFRNLISETVGSPEKEILGALLLGDKKRVPDEILQNFNCSGLSHVLAISGLHVGIIASFSFFIIRCLIRTSTFMLLHGNITKVSACISMVPVVGYAALAGFGISTVRAAIMIATFLLSLLFSRKGNALNSLALAAFIILLFSPSSFFDISFQLSFSAVAAILLLTPRASAFFIQHVPIQAEKFKKVFAAFVTFVMVNIAATLGTAPLIIHTFNSISVITSLSNLLIVPVIGFAVLPIGLAGFLLAPFSHFLALLLIKSAAFFVTLSLMIISYLASLPCSFITISTPHILEIACYYIILLSFVPLDVPIIVRKYNFIKIVCIAAVFLFVSERIICYFNSGHSNTLSVTAIDVGQGSATLIIFPDGTVMLVDGGGFYDPGFDTGKLVVAPFLWNARISTVDIVVLSHPDIDHLGGLPFILENFNVKEVWSNGEKSENEVYKTFIETIRKKDILHRIFTAQDSMHTFGDSSVLVFRSSANAKMKENAAFSHFDCNNNSLVLKVQYGSTAFLLPGDIMESRELELVETSADLKSRIMLVPHHGAGTSSSFDFLKEVQPEIAVCSCGADNIFGFPHIRTIRRYEKMGIKMLRTDQMGAITITTDGLHIDIHCGMHMDAEPCR